MRLKASPRHNSFSMVTGCKMAVASVPVTTITSGAWATSSAARRQRARDRRAAERSQEFPSSDVACHVTLRVGVIHAMEG
jgi:hypothetical protein